MTCPLLEFYLPPRCRDPYPRDLDRAPAGEDALGGRGREPGAHELDHLLDREVVRDHDRLGAAVTA
jgi:hypothetical protein